MKVKVICLNLWHGGRLLDGALDFLRTEDADIVLLQEVYDGANPALERRLRSLIVLRETLDNTYYHFAPSDTDNLPEEKVVMGNAILSKFPIIKSDVTFFDLPYRDDYTDTPENWPDRPRNLQHVEITTPAGLLNVFNFHGVWDLDGDNFSPQRKQMSEVILKAIEGKKNVILAGDTNAKETNPALRAIEQHLTSVFGSERATSFNMRQKDNPGYATATVDHMYISPNIQVLSKQCPDVDISDHLPLIVELEIA